VRFCEYVTGGIIKVPENLDRLEHFWLVWAFRRARCVRCSRVREKCSI
jgi:hypothetical protein